MKYIKWVVLGILLESLLMACSSRKNIGMISDNLEWDIYSDTWVATDALGRTMPEQEDVGEVKTDKRRVVGIFYITWHSDGLAI